MIKSTVLTLLGAALVLGTAAYGQTTTQTVTGGSAYYYEGNGPVDAITLADGTNVITDLSTSGIVYDQGWGGTGASSAYLSLNVDGNAIWAELVAVAYAPYGTGFDVDINTVSDPTDYANLNAALAGVDWTSAPSVTVELDASAPGWTGWSVEVDNADLSVTSAAVPDTASTLALLGGSLLGLALLARSSRLRGLLSLSRS